MKSTLSTTILALALVGCTGGVVEMPIVDTTWSLQADGDDALVDLAHVDFGAYPNPKSLKQMYVMLQDDGTLCANDGKKDWCGGPVQGIPYLTILNVRPDSYCVRVVDIFGNYVRTACQDGEPPETLSGVLPNLPTPEDQQQTPPATNDVTQPAQKDGVMVGTKLVIDAVNAGLAKIGLKVQVPLPDSNDLADFDSGDIVLGKGTCEDVKDYLDSEFSDDHPGTDDYVFGPEAIQECLDEGRCRIGQLVTRAMAEACSAMPPDVDAHQFQTGVVGAGGQAVTSLCKDDVGSPITKCVGSPLVLDLSGDGLQLKGHGVAFPLIGARPVGLGWLAGSDDALLALDLDGDGRITSGRELFGEATGRDGFAALARHDANGDGVISRADPVFERLIAWRDDGDGRSQQAELLPLTTLGIRSISLRHERSAEVDVFGNELRLRGAALDRSGKRIPVVDVFFRIGSSSPPR
jgi:hypothetical protein